MNKLFLFILIVVVMLSGVEASAQDTTEWADVRAKIAHEDFFVKYHPTAIHYMLRANLEMQIKQFDLSIKDYTKTIELDAKNAEAYNKRGKARACIKNYPDAIADFEMAVKLNPDEQSYKDNLKLMQIRESIKH